jgi:hypothetical protein
MSNTASVALTTWKKKFASNQISKLRGGQAIDDSTKKCFSLWIFRVWTVLCGVSTRFVWRYKGLYRPCLAWELSLWDPKHSELDCYVNEVIQLWQVICLYTKSYCPLGCLHKNSHTTGFITLFITLNIVHVCQISHLIFWKRMKTTFV